MKNKVQIDPAKIRPYLFYLVIFFVLAVESGLLIFIGWPAVGRIFEAKEKLAADTAETENLKFLVSSISQSDEASLNSFVDLTRAALPDEKKTGGVILGLIRLASGSGVAVNNLEFSPGLVSTGSAAVVSVVNEGTLGNGVLYVPASLGVTAGFGSLANFLETLGNSSQLIGVKEVDYSQAGSKAEAKLGLEIYYQPPKTGAVSWKQVKPLTPGEAEQINSLPSKDIFTIGPEQR